MLEENEKVETVEEPKITEDTVEETKKIIEEEILKANGMSEREQEIYKELLETAKMPVELDDAKLTLGDNELDIRKLSKKNKEQMHFRNAALQLTYLKAVNSSLVDIIRLLMIICDKLGVEDIIQATDDIIEKQKNQHAELNLKKEKQDA